MSAALLYGCTHVRTTTRTVYCRSSTARACVGDLVGGLSEVAQRNSACMGDLGGRAERARPNCKKVSSWFGVRVRLCKLYSIVPWVGARVPTVGSQPRAAPPARSVELVLLSTTTSRELTDPCALVPLAP